MTDIQGGQIESFVDQSIQKAGRIEQALGHLAKAIELELVDVALDPSIVSNGSREKFVALGQKLAELSGISYELVVDISTATGIPIETGQEEQRELPSPSARALTPPREVEPTPPAPEPLATATPQPPVTPPISEPQAPEGAATITEPVAEAKQTPKSEKGELPSGEELYEKIIDPSILPEMQPVDESEAINLVILANDKVKIGQRQIVLKKHELFLFNALLLLRDKPRASGELRALGFYPGASKATTNTAFWNGMKNLSEQLNRAAGKEVIKKLGEKRSSQYALNPKLVLADIREEADIASGDVTDDVKKN